MLTGLGHRPGQTTWLALAGRLQLALKCALAAACAWVAAEAATHSLPVLHGLQNYVYYAPLGVYLMAHDHIEAPQFHTFYGFLTIISVAIIHSYRQQLQHRLYLLYGLGGLFVMGLGIRALVLQ